MNQVAPRHHDNWGQGRRSKRHWLSPSARRWFKLLYAKPLLTRSFRAAASEVATTGELRRGSLSSVGTPRSYSAQRDGALILRRLAAAAVRSTRTSSFPGGVLQNSRGRHYNIYPDPLSGAT